MSAPPTPKGAPVIGSALDLQRDMLGTLEAARREHGDVVRFVAGPPGVRSTLYALFHPDAVRRVLATEADRYRKDNRFYQEVRWALGDGLLNSQDERWLRQRRFVQPLFTRRRIAGYADAMAQEAGELVSRWERWAGGAIDAHQEMSRITLRVVGRLLFGADVERAVPVVRTAFPLLGDYTRRRALSPVAPPRHWRTPANHRAHRAKRDVYGVCDQLIAERRAQPTGGDDLLSLLIDARDNGDALDDAEIRDQILIFMLAGHDTTAIALTFALHLLGHHPEAQARLHREVDAVLGDRPPTAEDVEALPYTMMVLKESMRLYPRRPVWGGARTPATASATTTSRRALTSWSSPGSPTGTRTSGPSPSDSTPSASPPSARTSATATPTSRSAPGRAPASASTSRCSRRRSCSRRSRAVSRCSRSA